MEREAAAVEVVGRDLARKVSKVQYPLHHPMCNQTARSGTPEKGEKVLLANFHLLDHSRAARRTVRPFRQRKEERKEEKREERRRVIETLLSFSGLCSRCISVSQVSSHLSRWFSRKLSVSQVSSKGTPTCTN